MNDTCEYIFLRMCYPVCGSRVYWTDPKILLGQRCGRLGVSLQRSRTCHEKREKTVLTCRSFGESGAVGSNIGSLAYGDREKELEAKKRYGTNYMEVTAKLFCRWSLNLSNATTDNKEREHFVLAVTAPFCASQ